MSKSSKNPSDGEDYKLLQATEYGFMGFGSPNIESMMKFNNRLKSYRLSEEEVLAFARECVSELRGKLKDKEGSLIIAKSLEDALNSNPANEVLRGREVCDTCVRIYTMECFIYKEVNGLLRQVESIDNGSIETIMEKVRKACGALASYVFLLWEGLKLMFAPSKKSEKKNVTLYRGQRMSLPAFQALCAQEGRFVVFPCFTSFSDKLEAALEFPKKEAPDPAKEVDPILELDSFSRPAIHALSAFKNEKEVVMHPFSAFKVLSSTKAGPSGRPVVKLCDIEIARLRQIPPASSTVADTSLVHKPTEIDSDVADFIQLAVEGNPVLSRADFKAEFLEEIGREPTLAEMNLFRRIGQGTRGGGGEGGGSPPPTAASLPSADVDVLPVNFLPENPFTSSIKYSKKDAQVEILGFNTVGLSVDFVKGKIYSLDLLLKGDWCVGVHSKYLDRSVYGYLAYETKRDSCCLCRDGTLFINENKISGSAPALAGNSFKQVTVEFDASVPSHTLHFFYGGVHTPFVVSGIPVEVAFVFGTFRTWATTLGTSAIMKVSSLRLLKKSLSVEGQKYKKYTWYV